MVTNASPRFLRPSLIATAALAAALIIAPRAAEARGSSGHGGGGGHSGGGHSGVSHSGGSAFHGSAFHGGSSHKTSFHGTSFRGTSFHGGSRGGVWRGGWRGHRPFRFSGWGGGWGWGWAPFYSSWWWGGWWGGPSVYVVGDDGDYEGGSDYGSAGVSARTGRYAIVKTDVSPEEALVFLDGKYIGTADDFDGSPDYLYLGAGKYHIEFRLPGYQTYATDLSVSRGQRVRLDEKLKLEPGKSSLDQFPPESKGTPLGRVFTKGGPEGGSEAEEEGTPARPPRRARRPDDGWGDRDMAPAPRERIPEERVDVRDEPLPRPSGNRARMRFKVSPEDAAVYVDDKYLGAGGDLAANPRGVVTDPGTHSITVARPGYKTKTVDVTVRIGAPVDVVVELEK
jgi:hypothetical protein